MLARASIHRGNTRKTEESGDNTRNVEDCGFYDDPLNFTPERGLNCLDAQQH
jgi:hypothetical protein